MQFFARGYEMIELQNISKIFGNRQKDALQLLQQNVSNEEIRKITGSVVAVRDATLRIPKDNITVIMGLSGSGKSTLLRCINLLIQPSAGHVYLDIESKGKLELTSLTTKTLLDIRRNHMAMVFQKFGLFPRRTVLSNVCFGLTLQKKNNIPPTAIKALELVGLSEWANAYPSQLSGGMQQRVGLARALATDVEILLMDEAFSALDPLIRHNMHKELLALQAELRKTILFVSHDLGEALRIGDQIVIMQGGQFVQKGKPEEIIMNPKTQYVKDFVKNADPSEVIRAETVCTKKEKLLRKDENCYGYNENKNNYVFRLTSNGKLRGVSLNNGRELDIAEFEEQVSQKNEREIDKILVSSCGSSVRELMEAMLYSSHPLVIISDSGEFIGIVTRKNILKTLLKRFGE